MDQVPTARAWVRDGAGHCDRMQGPAQSRVPSLHQLSHPVPTQAPTHLEGPEEEVEFSGLNVQREATDKQRSHLRDRAVRPDSQTWPGEGLGSAALAQGKPPSPVSGLHPASTKDAPASRRDPHRASDVHPGPL